MTHPLEKLLGIPGRIPKKKSLTRIPGEFPRDILEESQKEFLLEFVTESLDKIEKKTEETGGPEGIPGENSKSNN